MNIYQTISAVMEDVTAISKEKKNQQQGFMYRGIDDVMNMLHPLLSKHKVFAAPEVLEHTREERQTKSGGNLIYTILKVRYTFYAEDGSSVAAIVTGEGMDSADKSNNKALAAAMKYAFFQTFCIPTEDQVDADAETPPPSVKKTEKAEICDNCFKDIKGYNTRQGKVSAEEHIKKSVDRFGQKLCVECYKKLVEAQKAEVEANDLKAQAAASLRDNEVAD